MAQNIFSQLAQQTLSTATTPAGGGAAGDDDPTSAITAVAQEHGVNPNFLLGLAQLETRGGKATVKGQGVDSRNLFNIKDFSKAGTGIRALDKAEGSNDPYRRYDSASDSARDLVRLLGSKRYEGALTAQTPEEFAAALKRGGYATDPDHDKKVIATIRSIEAKGGTPAPAPAQPWDQGARYVPMEHMVPGGPPAHNPNKNPDFLRGAGDVALSFLQGAAGSVKSVTDLAGAGNAVSRGLDDVSKGLGQLKSEEAQQSLAYHQKKIKDAETNGDWKQEVGAYADMVWDMPADSLAQALGSLVTLGAGKAAQVVKLASSARKAGMTKEAFLKTAQGMEAAKKASNLGSGVNLGLGVGQGVGGVKGEQYERTYNAAKEEGLADDEAQALATEAQSYGKGWMQQAAGAALGYAAAKTGPLEKLASGQTVGAGGVLRRLAGGAGIEGATEGLQGGQARYAGNTAAIDAGVLDESQRFAGVAGTAFSEGLLGGVVGGGAGALGHPDVDPLATTKEAAKKPDSPISRAAVAGQPAKPEQQPAQTPVAAGASAQSQEADPTFAEMSDSVLLQLQRSLQERQAAGDEDITDDEIELAQAAKAEYERRMAAKPPPPPGLGYNPDPLIVFPDGTAGRKGEMERYVASLPEEKRNEARAKLYGYAPQPTNSPPPAAPAQPAGVFVSEEVQPAITVDLNPAPRAPSPFDAVPLEQDPAITQQQREDAATAQERRRKNMATLRLGAYNKNPMIEFLGRHGLQPETQNEFAPGAAERRKASVYGYGPVFRQNGKPLDLLLSNAQDEGFLPPGASESDLYDLVARAISGERVDPLYKTGSADALMQRLADERNAKEAASYEDFLAQQQALAADPDYDPFATFSDTENDYDVSDLADSGYSDAERSLQAEVSALAQAYSQLGFDADDVLEPLATQYESNPDEYYAQARQRLTQLIAQAAQPRGDSNLPQDSGEQAQAPIGREAANATSADDDALIDYAIEDDGEPDYFLQAQTARQLREREEAIAEQARLNEERQQALETKARADDERKRIAQASVQAADTFELGQNALDNLTGQTDLLAQMPAAQAERPASAAAQPTAQPQDGDILSDNGKPFAFEYGAKLRAKKEGGEVVQVAGGYVVRPTQGEATQADPVAGDKIDDEWTAFSEQSGTLGIPRAEMPQVKAQDRGAMVNFLKARGIDSSNEVMPARAIKPTQAEFSPAKVQEAAARTDGNRSIIVSADGYVVDGHHQWMAQRQKGEPVKVIKLDQPIGDVLQALKGMPSAQPEQAATSGERSTSAMPAFERYNDALDWVKERAKAQGLSVMAYRSTGEYKNDVLPQLEALYATYKAKWDADTAEAGKAMQQAMAKDGIRAGDVVEWNQPGAFLSTEKRTGTVKIDSNGVPHVHMDSEMAVSRAGGKVGYTKKLRWQPYMQKAGANVAQPERAQDVALANDGYVPAPPEFASFEAKTSLLGDNPDLVDSNGDLGLNERGEKIARTPWDKLSQQDRAMIISLSDSRRASSDTYNAKVRKEYWEIERRRLQGERTIQQANGNPFKTEASAKAKLDEFDLGETHIIRQANDGGFVLRDKRDVRESYTQAQAAVLAEMGIGESADGEIDATESQWEEVDRRTTQRLKQMLPAPESTPNQPAISKKPAAHPQSDEEQIAAALEYADKMGLTGKDRQDAVVSELAFAWDMFKDEVAELDAVKVALRKKPSKAAKEARAEQIVKDVLRQASEANKAMEDAINADDVALAQPTIDTSPAAKWRDNWGEARRTAESLGLPTKDGKRNLKLTEMVPAIEAKLAQQDDAPLDVQAAIQGAVSVDKLSREDFDKVAGIFGIGGSRKPQPNTAPDQNAKNYAWIEKETGYAPMRPNGKPYILKTGIGKNEPIATSFGAKPSINDTARYFATEEDAANWGRENGYAVGGNPYAKNPSQPAIDRAAEVKSQQIRQRIQEIPDKWASAEKFKIAEYNGSMATRPPGWYVFDENKYATQSGPYRTKRDAEKSRDTMVREWAKRKTLEAELESIAPQLQPSTPLARAEAELSDWKARRNLPTNANNVADVDKEINRLEQTVAALRQVEYGNTQAAAIERVNAGNSQYINTRTGKPQELTEAQQQAIEQAYKVAASGRASVDSIFEMDGQIYLVAERNGKKKAALLPKEGMPKPAADILLGHGYADRRNTLITRQEYEARQASDAKLKAEADKAAAEQDTPKVYRVTENGSHHGEYYVQRNKEWYRDVNGKLHAIGNRKGDNALLGVLDGAQTSDKMEFVGNYTGPGYATDLAGVKQSEQGGQAFADGKPRTPPEGLSVNEMKRWLSGWDAANVGASQAQADTEAVLTTYTPAEIEAQQSQQEQVAKAEAARKRAEATAATEADDRRRIAQASVAAADSFELGQDPMDSLTGQKDVFADAAMQEESRKGTPTNLQEGIQQAQRFEIGRSLTKEQRKQVLGSLVDVYKAKGAEQELKGVDNNGNEKYGYAYSPDLFEKSSITGAMVRYYVTLPDGRIAHPTEIFPDYSQSDIDAELSRQQADEQRIADSVARHTAPDVQFNERGEANKYWNLKSLESIKQYGSRTILPATERTALSNGNKIILVPPDAYASSVQAFESAGWKLSPHSTQNQLESIFRNLSEARGAKKKAAQDEAKAHPQAAKIEQVQEQFHDVLISLMESGRLKVNGFSEVTKDNQSCL